MPKERPTVRTLDNCSYCGHHKDEVPLMITNAARDAAICSVCALSVVDQTFQWAGGIYRTMVAEQERRAQSDKKIVTGDKVNDAINKVQR